MHLFNPNYTQKSCFQNNNEVTITAIEPIKMQWYSLTYICSNQNNQDQIATPEMKINHTTNIHHLDTRNAQGNLPRQCSSAIVKEKQFNVT